MSETEAEYYDGMIGEKTFETERERDLQWVNKSLVRQNAELRAEIRGINKAYELLEAENEALKEQVKNLTEANDFLFKLLGELIIASDKMSTQNDDLKQKNENLKQILVNNLKRK